MRKKVGKLKFQGKSVTVCDLADVIICGGTMCDVGVSARILRKVPTCGAATLMVIKDLKPKGFPEES